MRSKPAVFDTEYRDEREVANFEANRADAVGTSPDAKTGANALLESRDEDGRPKRMVVVTGPPTSDRIRATGIEL